MTHELYSEVILLSDVGDAKAGDVGVVVEKHVAPGKEDGYSVEFMDMTGATVTVETVGGSLLRSPKPGDRPAVREAAA
jgi:hypothetical protein